MSKLTKKWLEMAEYYKRFSVEWESLCDFSDKAAQEMFDYESRGIGNIDVDSIFSAKKINGYALGKKWMDVTITSWKEGIRDGWFLRNELLADGYSESFLQRVGI